MQQVPASLWTLLAGILITVISIWVGQHHSLLPEAASLQAPLVDGFFNIMFTIGTALFLVVEGTILIFLIKYRKRREDNTDGVPIEGNISLEILWTAIPAVIVVGLGVYSVDIYTQMGGFGVGSHNHDSAPMAQMSGTAIAATLDDAAENPTPDPTTANYGFGSNPQTEGKAADLVVNVQGMQFAWVFDYPESGVNSGELHVPVGADVQLNLSASDVIHSFWVPQFRLKQDAIPGIPTQLRFVATKVGTYPIVCAELCGGYHGSMRSQVIVHEPEEFADWVKENQQQEDEEVAQKSNLHQAIAVNPANLPVSDFLAPYIQDMGVSPDMVKSMVHHH